MASKDRRENDGGGVQLMATTSLWRVKGAIGDVIKYAENEEKTRASPKGNSGKTSEEAIDRLVAYAGREEATDHRKFVTGLNCSPDRAPYEMNAVKQKFGKEDGTLAYHGYQSFKEGEVTPEQAHRIAVKLADELWGDRYQVIVATHLDKQSHIHSHFVINTVSFVDGKKFHRTKEDYRSMQKVSDRLCREEKLSVVKSRQGISKSYGEWNSDKQGKPTYRGLIRGDIDRAIKASLTEQEFFKHLEESGYEFKFYSEKGTLLERPSLKPMNSERFFRFDRLGEDYSLEEIRYRILENMERTVQFTDDDVCEAREYVKEHPPKKKEKGFMGMFRYYCYLLNVAIVYPTSVERLSIQAKEDMLKIDRLDQEVRVLTENHIETKEDLDKLISGTEEKLEEYKKTRNSLRTILKREVRNGNQEGADAVRRSIAEVTEGIQGLRTILKASERILGKLDKVEKTTEELDRQIMGSEKPVKDPDGRLLEKDRKEK